MSKWWRFRRDSPDIEDKQYIDYIDGIFSIMGVERGNSVGLEEEDAEDEDVEKLPEEADLYHQSLNLEPAKIPGFKPDFATVQTQLAPSDADEDLIDRQLESDCPELCANHYQVTEYDDFNKNSARPCDIWEAEEREISPCTRRASSLGKFVYEPFNFAEDSGLADPQIAHVSDWEGSPWRSITPFRPVRPSRTEAITDEKRLVIIDLSQDTEDEG